MKNVLLLSLIYSLFLMNATESLDITDLSTVNIIGKSGKPLGSVFTVSGKFVDGNTTGDLADRGKVLLSVESVNDIILESAYITDVIILFSTYPGEENVLKGEKIIMHGIDPNGLTKDAIGQLITAVAVESLTVAGINYEILADNKPIKEKYGRFPVIQGGGFMVQSKLTLIFFDE